MSKRLDTRRLSLLARDDLRRQVVRSSQALRRAYELDPAGASGGCGWSIPRFGDVQSVFSKTEQVGLSPRTP